MRKKIPNPNQMSLSEIADDDGMYYLQSADNYHTAGKILYIILPLILVLAVVLNLNSLKARNVRALYDATKISITGKGAPYENIAYSARGEARFAIYQNDLAVMTGGDLSLYHPSGKRLYSADIGKGVVVGSKYLIFRHENGNELIYYSDFGKAKTLIFDGRIGDVAVNRKGMTALSVMKDAQTEVILLDATFREVSRCREKGEVLCLAVSGDGKRIAAISVTAVGGLPKTSITVKNKSMDKVLFCEAFSEKTPLDIGFFEDGSLYASFTDCVMFFSPSWKCTRTVLTSYGDRIGDVNGEYLLLASPFGRMTVYTSDGDEKAVIDPGGAPKDIVISSDNVYFLMDNTVKVYSLKRDRMTEYGIDAGALALLVPDDGSILLCYSFGTKRFVPSP